MPGARVVQQEETYRLIADRGGYAVVEVRNGRVYSLAAGGRAEADDTPEGMSTVVGSAGWMAENEARALFRSAVKGERRFGEIIW